MNSIILGGGIAGLSLASFLKATCTVLEKQPRVGGLCQSFEKNGIHYDIGPHIIFSKNDEVLRLHTSMIETNKIRRSNKIFFNGRLLKYPFENDLYHLPANVREYCLKEFINNPYEVYKPENMQQFFLKTFGEGITKTYLQPYNEKIWKYDPSCMDIQMVERIPKPPKEDIIKSAEGVETEGYLHQLYFYYPRLGGFQTLINQYSENIKQSFNSKIVNSVSIHSIEKHFNRWAVQTDKGVFESDLLFNCMPLHELFKVIKAPDVITDRLNLLKFNSIHIVLLQFKKDAIGDNFALYFPDKETIFHRLSKLNYLGENYCLPNDATTLLAEITYRPDSYLATLNQKSIKSQVLIDLAATNLIQVEDLIDCEVKTFKYAYVIYDLDHRKNVDFILNYLRSIGIESVGRFAEFEYLNSDQVVERTLNLANKINAKLQN